ncbi:MAG: hypothetical protein A2339_00685 [Elusimicrobia bacterium RIFOXYB12_FULL_50_12]|nr:MAG: hypothetical protein A2278_05390 [Elusimicrobia bacterium RIFOXYA12_FULL_49_49]OGS11489.1 MAG: hypothetical protein A2386_07680 [Elusimicrobia bacterium RIFOXYB1_FULL_48_9]OGS16489.1 MAG: hypothetical protein A2251_06670 [Elusimicrobia bacterium RIFOXYA2_FULL_47_53]OGS25884.1 MAG: hypothetical protein A2339_00685 [Elusimicrobia bacterium RIFOXYB12_FULL_50_12]OGS31226.1 MAG: hypothetical protein A2323_00955 [Elusimicrobia bacterium RIFOXYB2_FULL_46_23]
MKKYSVFSHTADIGIKGAGRNLAGLFICLAKALATLLKTEQNKNKPVTARIKLSAPDTETLLVAWLNEIIYLNSKKRAVFDKFKILEISPGFLKAEIYGKKIIAGARPPREIKAATFHKLKILKSAAGFSAKVILDI